jgi:peptide/nickel transport system permease protein
MAHVLSSSVASSRQDSAPETLHSGSVHRDLTIRRLLKRFGPKGYFALVVISAFGTAALFAPFIAPHSPITPSVQNRLQAPSIVYFLGTDELGRDILSRIIYGTRVSYTVGLASAVLAGILGVPLGLIAGYFGGYVDRVVSAFIDVLFTFPAILLSVALVAMLGASISNIIIALGIVVAPTFARLVRASVLILRESDFVEAAHAYGAWPAFIIRRHILPNALGTIVVQASLTVSYGVIVEASLSYIGLGVRPPTPSWGSMLIRGYGYLEAAPWATLAPGLAVVLNVLAFNMLGDTVGKVLDPVQSRR